MSKKFRQLLSPIMIGNVIIKNRMMYPNASPHFLQGPETYPAEGFRAFMADLAKNGAAIITLAEWNNPHQRVSPIEDGKRMQSFDLNDPSVHNYFSQMANEIHFFGSKLLVGADVDMPTGYTLNGGPAFGPPVPGAPKENKPLPKEMMPEVIGKFIEKLKMYRSFGYDGVAMRVDHVMALSPFSRKDEFGGSVENRTRFIRMVFSRVKAEMGNDFILEACVAGEQPHGYGGHNSGYTLGDGIQFAKLCDGVVDILQVRESDVTRSHPTGYTFKKGEHRNIEYCRAMKAAGVKRTLLEPIGGYQDPDELESYLESGACDMFGMARAFMCDPEYGKKLYEGRGEDIVPCLWCNKCHGTVLETPDPWLSVCSVNPKLGIGHKLDRLVSAPEKSSKVAVIGGGPAGMKAAIVAAERGHDVTLFEMTDTLGGQLVHGDHFQFKWPVGEYKNYLIRRLGQVGVHVVMNTAPAPGELDAADFDVVFAATGAAPAVPDCIDGLTEPDGKLKPAYRTCFETFGKEKELGKRVIIIGGSETGVETAMYLCDNGHEVTVLT
ncbi:MAG: FAD-dependent oxidoreductase, partial [Clostridiales bacterium]|nr:FAD-dependent oxidoreductase [Clostridiales bacterium]